VQDVFAQHVRSTGAIDPAYPERGLPLALLPAQSSDAVIVSAGPGGAIAAWTDNRNGNTDIFAMQVREALPTGILGSVPPAISLLSAFPNPAGAGTTLRFVLANDTPVTVAIYDVAGHRVRALAAGVRPAGSNELVWDMRDDAGREVTTGVYFARLGSGSHALTRKLVKIK
jgi:flagellar hook capping protein FlgD